MSSKKRIFSESTSSNNNNPNEKDDENDYNSNDSSENEDDTEINDENYEDENEEDDILDLPRRFYYFALEKVNNNIIDETITTFQRLQLLVKSYDTAVKALDKSISILFENNKELSKLYEKSLKRSYDDRKVAPGSNAVKRSIEDDRFLLYLISLLQVKIYYRLNIQNKVQIEFYQSSNIYQYLRNAMLWFPRGIEGNYLFSCYMKSTATSIEQLNICESHLRKAIIVGKTLLQEKRRIYDNDFDEELVESEIKYIKDSIESLILLLIQTDRFIEAKSLLIESKYQCCLHQNILNYNNYLLSPNNTMNPKSRIVKAFDHILSNDVITHLKEVFRSNSDFWKEHDYDDMNTNSSQLVGYFSYIYPFKNRKAICSVEQIIDFIYQFSLIHFPEVAQAQYAEWWTHNRTHTSGHQLHFDSDETAIEFGDKPSHPIVSIIIYLSDIGGPTLVTDQTLQGSLATNGWLCFPKENRTVIFDAGYLHGVIPGIGFVSSSMDRRLSFMIGFWKDIKAKDRGRDSPGPGQPFPTLYDSQYTWPQSMPLMSCDNLKNDNIIEIDPIFVPSIWQPLQENDNSTLHDISYDKCFQGF